MQNKNQQPDPIKKGLLFDFAVDKSNNKVIITREFNAASELVWDAFTQPEILDQWGAPEPWTVKTKHMNFKEGGRRFYAMRSPEGQEHWSVQDYTSITPKTNIKFISGFSDQNENINPEFYGSENEVEFFEENGITTVKQIIKYKTVEILQMMVERGFREGVKLTMDNLEKYLFKHLQHTSNHNSNN